MLGDPHDAADALQDTFLAAGTRLHQLRDPTRFRPWLFAIARRQAYGATSARRRTEPLPDDDGMVDVTSLDVDPTDALADEELRHLVDAAADGLDERDRAVLELHFRLGLGGDELAAALGVERGNAHVLVHRVRERLQRSMGALVVARHGRAACPELSTLLGSWDGQLSTVLRKRVSRHTDDCETCGATREHRMRPSALLGVIPLAPLPAEARERLLGELELCSATVEPWPGDDGFPPGDDRPVEGDARSRASRTLVAALVALLVVLLAGSVVLADADPVDRGLSTSSNDSTSTTRELTTTSTPASSTSSSTATTEPVSTSTTRRPTTSTTTRRPAPTTPPSPTTTAPPPTTTAPPSTTTSTTRPRPTTTTTSTTRPPPTTTTSRTTTSTTLPPIG